MERRPVATIKIQVWSWNETPLGPHADVEWSVSEWPPDAEVKSVSRLFRTAAKLCVREAEANEDIERRA